MNSELLRTSLRMLVLPILFLSCENDDDFIPDGVSAQVTAQFEKESQSVSETSGTRFINVLFNKPASEAGQLKIHVDKSESQVFSTEPAAIAGIITLNVDRGDRSAIIAFTPMDNATVNNAYSVTFTINEVSVPFVIGLSKKHVATIVDNESPAPAQSSRANFIPVNATIAESNAEGFVLSIHLSEPTASAGTINIHAESEKAIYGIDYRTDPGLDDGVGLLAIGAGSSVTTFKVIPLANGKITGELKITFVITETAGPIIKGNVVQQDVRISDSELALKPKSYEISGGQWGLKKFFDYDEAGNVSLVHWDSYTPYHRSGTDTHFYESGLLARINKGGGEDIIYTSHNRTITKSERVINGVLKQYTEYDYDDHGNVSGTADYYRQPDGTFKLGFLTVFLYFENGNLYKQLRYSPGTDQEDYVLLATYTYDGYLDVENPFPIEIIPTVKSQKTLPTSYRVEEHGMDLLYSLTYEFLPDGRPAKRHANGPGGSEVAAYDYY